MPDRRLHIVHLIDSLALGGAERMLVDLANQTAADGHRVTVCVTRSDRTLAPELAHGIELLVLGRTRTLDPLPTLSLVRWIRSHAVDVLHVHMRSSLAFALALRTARLVRTPIVFHDHRSLHLDARVPAWFRIGGRHISAYVGVDPEMDAWARAAGIAPARIHIVPNALDLGRLTPDKLLDVRALAGIPADALVGICVASLRPEKGIDMLVEAVALANLDGRARIVVVGSDRTPHADHCRQLRRSLGLDDVVTFLGARRDVPSLLPGASFALLPSRAESGPLVLVEYLAAGLPFIATRVGDIGNRLASLGIPGFVAAGDPAEFARELIRMVELAADERTRRGEAGRALVREHWDLRTTMPRWYGVYDAALALTAKHDDATPD